MAGLIGTSLSGLLAAQRSLETTSHNIANVNTDGYSRQRAELGTRPAEFSGAGWVGYGVNVETIARSYDQFITNQLNSSSSAFSETDAFSNMASRVDNIIANESTGLSPVLKSFFNAVNEVANNPSSIPVRQVLISEAGSLTQQFNTMSAQFSELLDQTNSQMQGNVDDINTYAKEIADLNAQIMFDSNRTSTEHLPNDLLDKRDLLVSKIAELVNVNTIPQQDGSLSVFLGKGQSLVLGAVAGTVSLAGTSTDINHKEVLLNGQIITPQIAGGELFGSLKFRDQILDPAQQQLGLVAAGFAVEFNKLHTTGFDLNGDAGTDIFSFGTPTLTVPVIAAPGSTGSIDAVYDAADTGALTASDYRLDYDGANYSLTRLSDNTLIALPGTFPGAPASVEGLTITQTAAQTGVSSFLIRPAYNAAQNMTTSITDPAKIAAAGTTGGPGLPIPGDNSVALGLAGLEKKSVLFNGKTTFNDAYGQLVSKVGTLTHSAKISRSAQEVLLNQAKQSRENLAGVNLDEEAANLIKFQNSYQAAAQAISVAHSLFDTLIGAVR
jgi:flagellar hook-associated protein 1 FlgK